MDQLSAMRVFLRVVETGSFTGASAALGVPKATVSNLIQNLETHLQTKLLNAKFSGEVASPNLADRPPEA